LQVSNRQSLLSGGAWMHNVSVTVLRYSALRGRNLLLADGVRTQFAGGILQ